MVSEHQARWLAQKAQSPDDLARVADMRQTLRVTVGACREQLERLVAMLDDTRDFPTTYALVDQLAELTRILARVGHWAKFTLDWSTAPLPEFTDHSINQYFIWPEHKRTFWLEGAVLSALAMTRGGRYLELCCGSGFYADLFYAAIAREVVAVDLDPRAIEFAQRRHGRDNVHYQVVDVRQSLPEGPFDGVIWDGAIEHFSDAEIHMVMHGVKRALVADGLLSGYTVAERGHDTRHPDHEQAFAGMTDLGALLKPWFKNVLVLESVHATIEPPRHNLFFFASDGALPFDGDWPRCHRA